MLSDVLTPCVDTRKSSCTNARPLMVAIDGVSSNTAVEYICAKRKDKFENCIIIVVRYPKLRWIYLVNLRI